MRHKSGGNSARRTPNSRNLIGIGKGLMLTINRFTFLFYGDGNVLSSSAYGQDPPQLVDVRRQSVQRK